VKRTPEPHTLGEDPLWYKDAIIYELHVRAFYDEDGDGIGDFKGLSKKLDYLQQIGINAIWLLPFYPSPLRDDGYDISDYYKVHPYYGNIKDFKNLLNEAHSRGIRVITELVINHTSDQHPWFQRARRAKPDSSYRNFYVWSEKPDKYRETRIIFKDFEQSNWTYDPVAKEYYWHRFYSHQPDLNFDNPATKKAVSNVMDYWFSMGVDGMRLDAVPYLYEREGTDCENLPETHEFLKELRQHLDKNYKNRILLAEANQWPEDAAKYFGTGDECHMNFNFPLMPRLFMAIHMEDRYSVIDILKQTPQIPDNAQWALFLRNHDELTLEMVTDEERDYMYRVYAMEQRARINLGIRRRLAPLLNNNRRRIELMYALLFSLPGTPVLYYGDELGMGDNIYLGDRNGVRTPMQWSSDRNAGFSRANPQSLYLPIIIDPEYHYETVNVESHIANSQSLLWWVKRIIALRKRFQAFGRGSIEFLHPENRKLLVFLRKYDNELMLVVANLSRFAQYAQLDLSDFQGMTPRELFGRTRFPAITEQPYMLSLGPHSFYWFALEPPLPTEIRTDRTFPELRVKDTWHELLNGKDWDSLTEVLQPYIKGCRWFGGKAWEISELSIFDNISITYNNQKAYLMLIRITYSDAEPEIYLVPLGFVSGDRADEISGEMPQSIIARVITNNKQNYKEGFLFDPTYDQVFAAALLKTTERRRQFKGLHGSAVGLKTKSFRKLWRINDDPLLSRINWAEQSNTSLIYDERLIFKLYRRLEEGINPDLELSRFLSEKAGFDHIPLVAGHIEYQRNRRSSITLGMLQGYVRNGVDAWNFTLDELDRFLDRAETSSSTEPRIPIKKGSLLELTEVELPIQVGDMIGPYTQSVQLLGQRTAEMHIALASDENDPTLSPELFTPFYRRALYQSMRNLTGKVFEILRKELHRLPGQIRGNAREVLGKEKEIIKLFHAIIDQKISTFRIRTHGDYHLGQVLYTGRDFVIIDFEGEVTRSLEERRLKRSPIRDVACMVRSFHYAANTALNNRLERNVISEEEAFKLDEAVGLWYRWVAAQYVKSYLETAKVSLFLNAMPRDQIETLLTVYRLEKAIYELGYELNNRPGWVKIPLTGILYVLGEVKT